MFILAIIDKNVSVLNKVLNTTSTIFALLVIVNITAQLSSLTNYNIVVAINLTSK